MKLMRCREGAAVVRGGDAVLFSEVNAKRGTQLSDDLMELIRSGNLEPLRDLRGLAGVPLAQVTPVLPYLAPQKILCIGPNYKCQALEINPEHPEEPGSFLKPPSCLFDPEGDIVLPPPEVSADVDVECELGVIIGKRCRFVPAEHVSDVIFGYTTTLDLTALDVLGRSARYLTRAKSIDTFGSFGPVIVTPDEVQDIEALEVVTGVNGSICSRDFVRNMRHLPGELVRFHSDYFTLEPGDLISTGCPKAAPIKAGDTVQGRIDGVGTISARVTQGMRQPLY